MEGGEVEGRDHTRERVNRAASRSPGATPKPAQPEGEPLKQRDEGERQEEADPDVGELPAEHPGPARLEHDVGEHDQRDAGGGRWVEEHVARDRASGKCPGYCGCPDTQV